MNLIIIVLLFILYLFHTKRIMDLEDVVLKLNEKVDIQKADIRLINKNVQRILGNPTEDWWNTRGGEYEA